jgi:hypothetical protein
VSRCVGTVARMVMTRPMLTVTEAARAAQVSKVTIRRRLEKGRFPGATQEHRGGTRAWLIPVDDLLSEGFHLHAPAGGEDPQPLVQINTQEHSSELAELRRENERLRLELADQRARAEERGCALEDLRRAMRMLDTGPPDVSVAPGPGEPAPSSPQRRWWRRKAAS